MRNFRPVTICKWLPLLLIFWIFPDLSAQRTYDIRFPAEQKDVACKSCLATFARKPKEVQFSIQRDKANLLYFEISDRQWFDELFIGTGDGIAIDVVSRTRYGCDLMPPKEGQIRGDLLAPVYTRKLRTALQPYGKDRFRVPVGKIPEHLIKEEVEFNILFLSNHTLCRYQTVFNLEAYQWDLLDMGMYLDIPTYTSQSPTGAGVVTGFLKSKILTFSVPFEKNKATYSSEDLQPLYDSLRLTDYTIQKISIKAYSSVEGNRARNTALQEQRASSMVKALQSFQLPTFETNVSTAENWVEFLNDIRGTRYDSLRMLSKADLNSKLTGKLADALEIYLKNHRKAIISLELEKKDKYNSVAPENLIHRFNSAVEANDLPQATILHRAVIEKVKLNQVSPEILTTMNIPQQKRFVPLLNENAGLGYLLDQGNMLIAYKEMLALNQLDPDHPQLAYNLAALKLQLWHYKVIPIVAEELQEQISGLRHYAIPPTLVKRMLINFHIVQSAELMSNRDFVNKDTSVDYIYDNYSDLALSDTDYLSLSQFLSYYDNIEQSIAVLKDKVTRIDIDEDLLFFYLNLTLVDSKLSRATEYRSIMLNAINLNKERFCRLFNSFRGGGMTFQLLEDHFLRDTYCENCLPVD